MYIDTTFPPDGSARLAKFLRMAGSMQPDDIAIAVDALIAQLDARAGDPDIEANGDEFEDDNEDRCEAGDDGCGAFGIHGRIHWGSQEDDANEPWFPGSFGGGVKYDALALVANDA